MLEQVTAGGRERLAALFGRMRRPQTDAAPPTPAQDGRAFYAVGDIHGRLDLLLKLEERIRQDLLRRKPRHSILIFLGDYVDRGRDTRGVIEHLSTRQLIADEEIYLRGNHEQVMLDFLTQPPAILETWAQFGGLETLFSYGIKPRLPLTPEICQELQEALLSALPTAHFQFLRSTRASYASSAYFFVHAGVNPQISLAQQKPLDLLWIREEFLTSNKRLEKIVVHGHTPVAEPEVHPNRINVDTGAYVTGRLTCAVLQGNSCDFLSTIG